MKKINIVLGFEMQHRHLRILQHLRAVRKSFRDKSNTPALGNQRFFSILDQDPSFISVRKTVKITLVNKSRSAFAGREGKRAQFGHSRPHFFVQDHHLKDTITRFSRNVKLRFYKFVTKVIIDSHASARYNYKVNKTRRRNDDYAEFQERR